MSGNVVARQRPTFPEANLAPRATNLISMILDRWCRYGVLIYPISFPWQQAARVDYMKFPACRGAPATGMPELLADQSNVSLTASRQL
jgi:hypothetical protein